MKNVSYCKILFRLVVLWIVGGMGLGFAEPAFSHQSEPAIVTVLVQSGHVEITVRDALEPLIAISEIDPKSNADADLVNTRYIELRQSIPDDLEAVLRDRWSLLANNIDIYAGNTRLDPILKSVDVHGMGETSEFRYSTIAITADLPEDDTSVFFSWRADFGPLSVRQVGGNSDSFTELLQGGQRSQPMARTGPVQQSSAELFVRFVISGFEHIVPKGTDHILFVFGLFLFSLRIRSILAQVTAFTLAHSVTLALASVHLVSLPASIVEPLIAVSIVYVAVENILFAKNNRGRVSFARLGLVFCFGLLHGLGFASVLSDVGLPAGQFMVGLVGFNIGVEFGQLAVISGAFLLVGLPFGKTSLYRKLIVIPASSGIALMGAWWAIERVFL